jgi:hypothetical protein
MHGNPLHSLQISVWCAVSEKQIVGPLFEEAITVENGLNLVN